MNYLSLIFCYKVLRQLSIFLPKKRKEKKKFGLYRTNYKIIYVWLKSGRKNKLKNEKEEQKINKKINVPG